MFDFEMELKNLPDKSGVYLMKNIENQIIYVGKAKSLKNRVRQYFRDLASHTPKIRMLVSQIKSFEYIVTDTELEALVLECNLIKKHKPKYNVRLKDDKNYPYIKITVNEDFPRVLIVRKTEKDDALYFGPYSSSFSVRETLNTLKGIFAIRSCKKTFPKDIAKGRPCLNYHIKRCLAPCLGNITKKEYDDMIKEIVRFLNGDYSKLLQDLNIEMEKASNNFEYEKAARIRDKIIGINKISEKQKIISATKNEQDIIAFAENEKIACFEVFFIREGKMLGKESFVLENISDESQEKILNEFIKQFYNEVTNIPKEIIIEKNIDEINVIENWLSEKRGKKVFIKIPQKGDNKKILEMASKNASIALSNIIQKNEQKNSILLELKKILNLENIPKRIESYDISNTAGKECVGCMVVFFDGRPKKSEYRKFIIKNTTTPNDYEAMREMLYRRFTHMQKEITEINEGVLDKSKAKFSLMPDLIFIDGGKGHISTIKKLFTEMNINIPVFGLVKDERHKTRAIVTEKDEVLIKHISPIFNFLSKIQDEVHRAAISFHRKKRENITSVLDQIKGVGEKKKKLLLLHFKSLENIKKADLTELLKVKGIDKKTAQNVSDFFENNT